MYLNFAFLLGVLLSDPAAHGEAAQATVRAKYEAARQNVEKCRRDLSAAELRLMAVQTEQRIQSAVRSVAPAPQPRRNPEFDRLREEARSLESNVRRLAELMAPAHPELISSEAELQAARDQLAQTPEYLETAPLAGSASESVSPGEPPITAQIAEAVRQLERADEELQRALETEQAALSALLTASASQPVLIPAPALSEPKAVDVAPSRDRGWEIAGVVCVALLAILIASQTRAAKVSPRQQPELPPIISSRRIIYSAAEKPVPMAAEPRQARAPIVPRRRVS